MKHIEKVYLVYEEDNEFVDVSCVFKWRKLANKYIKIENAFDIKRFGEIRKTRRISCRRLCDDLSEAAAPF